MNVQFADYLLRADDDESVAGKYLCVAFNPFLRTTADGDDQLIRPAERPGIKRLRLLLPITFVVLQIEQLVGCVCVAGQ